MDTESPTPPPTPNAASSQAAAAAAPVRNWSAVLAQPAPPRKPAPPGPRPVVTVVKGTAAPSSDEIKSEGAKEEMADGETKKQKLPSRPSLVEQHIQQKQPKRSILILDSGAIIKGVHVERLGTEFYTIPEVINEIRDSRARQFLQTFPYEIKATEPDPQDVKAVVEFAKKTGDYASLSAVDMKVIALTRTFERENNGVDHLRAAPLPPTLVSRGKKTDDGQQRNNNNNHHQSNGGSARGGYAGRGGRGGGRGGAHPHPHPCGAAPTDATATAATDAPQTGVTATSTADDAPQQQKVEEGEKTKEALVEEEIKKEEEIKVSSASNEEEEKTSAEETPSTVITEPATPEVPTTTTTTTEATATTAETAATATEPTTTAATPKEEETSAVQPETPPAATEQPRKKKNNKKKKNQQQQQQQFTSFFPTTAPQQQQQHKKRDDNDDDDGGGWITPDNIKQMKRTAAKMSSFDDLVRKAKVGVACITTDYAMQNVLLQMGLHLLSTDGMVIKRLRTYLLQCHACFKTTKEMDKVFCPNCGHQTLRKVPYMLDDRTGQPILLANRVTRPVSARGTKFSLPLPKGGRQDQKVVLREDELLELTRRKKKKNKDSIDEILSGEQSCLQPRAQTQAKFVVGKVRKNPNESRRRTGKRKKNAGSLN